MILTTRGDPRPAGACVRAVARLPDAPLRARKIGDHLNHLPFACLALLRGGFDVAHAFTPADALAGLVWARRTARPALFTATEPPRRATIAARRLRLATLRRATEESAAVVAPDAEVADALRRWLAIDASVIAFDDADAHLALYRALL